MMRHYTYNTDEIGFQIGVASAAKVVLGTERAGRSKTTQPGYREWLWKLRLFLRKDLQFHHSVSLRR
jgi:hypothetical protein